MTPVVDHLQAAEYYIQAADLWFKCGDRSMVAGLCGTATAVFGIVTLSTHNLLFLLPAAVTLGVTLYFGWRTTVLSRQATHLDNMGDAASGHTK